MKKSQFGCLNLSGILAAAAALLLTAVFTYFNGGGLFSPGGLSDLGGGASLGGVYSHAELTDQCARCHPSPWGDKVMADLCLNCHIHLVQSADDFHGVMINQGKMTGCQSCHTEHNGSQGPLTREEITNFPHETVGFSLQTHQQFAVGMPFACDDCHTETFSAITPILCENCHLELDSAYMLNHLATFGNGCTACHDGVDRYGKGFDHNQTDYPLVGLHVTAACGDCHPDARSARNLQETSETCHDCHAADDAHAGELGLNCTTCHTPKGWETVTFDHSLTTFPLVGQHANLACQDCHLDGMLKGTPLDCFNCHAQDDTHAGKFGQYCAACHNSTSWDTLIVDHALTNFPLTGKHLDVTCESCHVNDVYNGTPMTCYECHSEDDEHDGQFGTDCASCHNPSSWEDATIDHSLTTFPLTGAHISVSCESCHVNGIFDGIPTDCYACHSQDDEHDGQYGAGCASCHNTSSWEGAIIDHSLTAFPLTGAHTSLACTQCHTTPNFRDAPTECIGCHAEPSYHMGLFSSTCQNCHSTSTWTPAEYSFPHSFPFDHGENNNPCRDCHPSSLAVYSCYVCHEQGETEKEHLEEGIADISACLSCHPDGQED